MATATWQREFPRPLIHCTFDSLKALVRAVALSSLSPLVFANYSRLSQSRGCQVWKNHTSSCRALRPSPMRFHQSPLILVAVFRFFVWRWCTEFLQTMFFHLFIDFHRGLHRPNHPPMTFLGLQNHPLLLRDKPTAVRAITQRKRREWRIY